MEVQGKIISIRPEEIVSDKFKKRNVWIETQEQYPQTLELQFVQDKTSILDRYKTGDIVEIAFNLRGRGFTKDGKKMVFNTLQGWKINKVQQEQQQVSTTTVEDDDLPF